MPVNRTSTSQQKVGEKKIRRQINLNEQSLNVHAFFYNSILKYFVQMIRDF